MKNLICYEIAAGALEGFSSCYEVNESITLQESRFKFLFWGNWLTSLSDTSRLVHPAHFLIQIRKPKLGCRPLRIDGQIGLEKEMMSNHILPTSFCVSGCRRRRHAEVVRAQGGPPRPRLHPDRRLTSQSSHQKEVQRNVRSSGFLRKYRVTHQRAV